MISATGFLDRFGVVDAPVEWGQPGRSARHRAGRAAGFEAGRAVLAAPELVVVSVGPALSNPARGNGAVYQAYPAVDQLDGFHPPPGRTPPVPPSRSESAY